MERRVAAENVERRARCEFEWCTTDHGATAHPDDEDHRSEGWGWLGRVRDGRGSGPGVMTVLEVGVLRRTDDAASWIVIETGIGTSLALSPEAAQTLARRLLDDGDVRAVSAPPGSAD